MAAPPAWTKGPKTWYPERFWPIAALLTGRRGLFIDPSPSFEEWAATVTPTEVHELLDGRFQWNEPPQEARSTSVSPEELARFDTVVASLTETTAPVSSDTEVAIPKVVTHLSNSNTELAILTASATESLERLLITHASFPFTASPSSTLTRSSLLRAVILLTSNSDKEFLPEYESKLKPREPRRRGRTQEQRLTFIFASLVSTLPRKGSADDILDILCRIPYPRKFNRKVGAYYNRPMKDLIPVAERLSSERKDVPIWQTKDQHLPVSKLRPLAELVAAVNGQPVGDSLSGKDQLDVEEFQAWAAEAKLMPALDKLFRCFLDARNEPRK